MSDEKAKLVLAIDARLEQGEHDVAHAAIAWLEVVGAPESLPELREAYRIRALGEYWRRARMRELMAEVRASVDVAPDRFVYFLALDACEPRTIPSFAEWLDERSDRPPATIPK